MSWSKTSEMQSTPASSLIYSWKQDTLPHPLCFRPKQKHNTKTKKPLPFLFGFSLVWLEPIPGKITIELHVALTSVPSTTITTKIILRKREGKNETKHKEMLTAGDAYAFIQCILILLPWKREQHVSVYQPPFYKSPVRQARLRPSDWHKHVSITH